MKLQFPFNARMTNEEECVCVCVCVCVYACVFIPSVLPCFDYTLRALSCPYCRMPPPGSLSTNAS